MRWFLIDFIISGDDVPVTPNADRITLDRLRSFVAVVEEGSFSAAARRLGRVQSAVSQAVATLEDDLGVQLLDRSGYRPTLTGPGAALLRHARDVLDRVEALCVAAIEVGGQREAEVSLVADAMFPLPVLVELARRFEQRWPGVRLRLQTETLLDVLAAVEDGDAVVGVANAAIGNERLAERPLGRVDLVPVASSEHPLARVPRPLLPADVAPYAQVVLSGRGREQDAPDRGVLSSHSWRVVDLDAKHAFIRAGLGWGRLPRERVDADLAAGTLVRLRLVDDDAPSIPLVAVWRPAEKLGPAARWVVDTLGSLTPAGAEI